MIQKILESITALSLIAILVWIASIQDEAFWEKMGKISVAKNEEQSSLVFRDALEVHDPVEMEVEPIEDRSWRKPSVIYKEFLQLLDSPMIFSESHERLDELLHDRRLLDLTEIVLLKEPAQNSLDLLEERQRIDAVEYLAMVLANLEVSEIEREIALNLVKKLLLEERIRPEMDKDLRRSLVGDQIELGVQFAVASPQEWQSFKGDHQEEERFMRLADFVERRIVFLNLKTRNGV